MRLAVIINTLITESFHQGFKIVPKKNWNALNNCFCNFIKHASIKTKYVRANEVRFMTKELHKAIMKRSRLKNKFLKRKLITGTKNYNFQRNYCKKLLGATKKSYFNNLDISRIKDNRSFWKTIVLLFFEKNLKSD